MNKDVIYPTMVIRSQAETIELLEKENKQLKKQYCERTDCSGRIKDSKKYDSLQQRIDKAIEYIENNEYKYYQDWGQDDGGFDLYLDENEIKQLKKILKGSEN